MLSSSLVIAWLGTMATGANGQFHLIEATTQPTSIVVETNRPEVELFEVGGATGRLSGAFGNLDLSIEQRRRVCQTPCRVTLNSGSGDYFIGGDGIVESNVFTLAGRGDNVVLRVEAGSTGLRRLGKAGIIVGSIVSGVGTLGTLLGLGGIGQQNLSGTSVVLTSGLVVLGVGLAMLIGGIVLMASNNTSVAVEQMYGVSPSGLPPPPPPPPTNEVPPPPPPPPPA